MALSSTTKEILLSNLFYSKNTQYTSIKSLYDAVKNKGITQAEVRSFLQKQDTTQLFKKPKRIKHYFPIFAKHKYEILQMDLVDMSDISTANKNYKYLLIAIDVFSRLAFVVPMKNKFTSTIIESTKDILNVTKPTIINVDQGSEFISHEFKKLIKDRDIEINYVDVGDHHKLGIVDRLVRTIREKINKYLAMHNTTNYIDVLPNIVNNYNLAYHSGIKKAPTDVEDNDKSVLDIFMKKYNLAKEEEQIYEVGDKVRYIINFKQFEKQFTQVVYHTDNSR